MSKPNEPVDVLIIGAGASGAAIAWSLLETRMRILCLEQGDHLADKDFPSRRDDYELARYGEFSCDPNVRRLKQDYPINSKESCITPVNWNGVGGSTINFLGHWPRMKPSDFKTKTLDGVAEDWPLDYAMLEPFYNLNDENTGVSGLTGNPAYPPYTPPLPPIPIGKLGQTLAMGFNKLGWHWWPSDVSILSQDHDGRQQCVNAGTCDLGCAVGAKGGANFTYWPILENAGVELRTQSRVREILINDTGFASGVLYHDAGGAVHEQKAELVIVACNGVGTPRLLLNSKSKLYPDGLANRSGMIGKNLMFHPLTGVAGVFDEPMRGHEGPMACSILSQEFYETDPQRDFVRGYGLHSGRSTTPMTYALGGYGVDDPIPWGAEHREYMDMIYPYLAGLTVVTEDLPEEENCVTLDPVLTDSDGIPAPKINYRLGENTLKMLKHGKAKAEELLLAAGAKHVLAKAPDKEVWWRAGWHQMGTCRMGDNPEKSVVNGWGRSHDVRNLFIVDGSIFVTAGAVNPTSTIQALALYIGDRIKTNIATLFD